MSFPLWHLHSSLPGISHGQSLAMIVDSGYFGLMWFSFAFWVSNGMIMRILPTDLSRRFLFTPSKCFVTDSNNLNVVCIESKQLTVIVLQLQLMIATVFSLNLEKSTSLDWLMKLAKMAKTSMVSERGRQDCQL